MFKFGSAAMLAAVAMAGDGDYNYLTNGADWGTAVPLCSEGKEQSPIDLSTEGASRSTSMQLNGYRYRDFEAPQADVIRTVDKVYADVPEGEFHLNFADGSKSVFKIL